MMYLPDTVSDYMLAAMMVLAIAGAITDVRNYRIPNSINGFPHQVTAGST